MLRITIILVALAGCSVPLVDAQADIADLCISYPNMAVTAVAPGTTTLDHTWDVTKLDAVQQLATLVTDLQLLRLDATPVTGITDFTFVQAAHVAIASGDPDSMLPTLDAYDCSGDCVPGGNSLDVPATVQANTLAYVETGYLVVDLQIDGDLPAVDWSMDLDVCFSGQVKYQTGL
jgi:hypothetical protein